MKINGWIAVGNHGPILGSFRKSQTEANNAARQALRVLGGSQLIGGFRLIRAELTIHEVQPPQKQETETG
jgi:hypothetical protein